MGDGMKGMNVERGVDVVGQIQVHMDIVDDMLEKIRAVKEALETNWAGPDQVTMIARIDDEAIPQLADLKDVLNDHKTTLNTNVEQQRTTSES